MGALEGTGTKFPNGVNVESGELFITDIAMTATATELNKLAGVTAGTASASKAVILDANKAIAGITVDASSNYLKNVVMAYYGNITTATLNAGTTLVAGITGRQIMITRLYYRVNGAFNSGGGTGITFQDTNSSPVNIVTATKAALTDGATISTEDKITNVTNGAGTTAPLTSGKGIAIAADASLSTGTSIDVIIEYMYV